LIAKGVPAKVKGRDVAKALIKVAEFVSSKDPMSRFLSNLEIYTNSKTAELANKRPYRLQLVLDQVEALESIFIANNPASVKDLEKAINSIFETKEEEDSLLGDLSKTPMVTLSTVHRAKGLEANRVFILDASRMKVNSRTEWQEKQEDNLHYVALTRSKDVLFISP
jgi:superfamily I DNA/RNA helicase